MQFLTIQIDQISKNYIQIQQFKNVVANPNFDQIANGRELYTKKEQKQGSELQSQTILPIDKMLIQTSSDVIPTNIVEKSSIVVLDKNGQIEFCAITLSLLNVNSFALPKYTSNQIIFKEGDFETYFAENQFLFNGEICSFERMMNILFTLSATTNGSPVEWGNLVGMIENQSDLMSQFDSKQINQIKFVLDQTKQYNAEIGNEEKRYFVKCQILEIDFGSFYFDPSFKYTLLVDRYRKKMMKKRIPIVDEKGDVIDQIIKYRKSKYHHESQIDAERNKRLNEIDIHVEKLTKSKLFPVQIEQHNYFTIQSFPFPTGIGKKYKALKIGFRLRIENEKSSIETGFIGFIQMVMDQPNWDFKDFTISFKH